MSKESAIIGKCPPKQFISELVDGDERAEVVAHLEQCGDCKRVDGAYRKIGAATRAGVVPSADLDERIKAACSRVGTASAPAKAKMLWFKSPVVRLAAAVAVSVSLLSLIALAIGRLGGEGHLASGDQGDAGEPVAEQMTLAQNPELPVPSSGVDVSGRVVQKVTYPGIASSSGTAGENPERMVLVQLPERVRHVWAVDDVAASETFLRKRLKGTAVSRNVVEPGRTSFEITLRDAELQKLVNDLSQHRWSLVSSGMPQPGSTDASYLGRLVTYNLELVKGGSEK